MATLLEQVVAIAVDGGFTLREAEDLFAEYYVKASLEAEAWNQCKAAKNLGIHRNTLARLIKRYPKVKAALVEVKGVYVRRVAVRKRPSRVRGGDDRGLFGKLPSAV